MAIDYATVRNWARKGHSEDDPALRLAWDSAVRELEQRTGWCADPVTRTQYIATEPTDSERLVRLERQPVTAATYVDSNSVTQSLTLKLVNGISYAVMPSSVSFPLTITVSAGNNTLDALLEMALLQRTVQLEASRGDDMTTLPGEYWNRICAMLGKGIG